MRRAEQIFSFSFHVPHIHHTHLSGCNEKLQSEEVDIALLLKLRGDEAGNLFSR